MSMACSYSKFFLFPSLPPELRTQISSGALPDKHEPALFFYRKDCWEPGVIPEDSPLYDPRWPTDMAFGFNFEKLSPIQIDVPLYFVNREARRVSLRWIHEQRIEHRLCKETQRTMFVRYFDLNRDVLYMGHWYDFSGDAHDRMFEGDLEGINLSCSLPLVRFALPKAILRTAADALTDLLDWFTISELLIVINPRPDVRLDHFDHQVQQHWTLERTQGDGLIWSREHGRFEVRSGENSDEKCVSKYIDQVNEGLGAQLSEPRNHNLSEIEIQPTYAVATRYR